MQCPQKRVGAEFNGNKISCEQRQAIACNHVA